jgi:hypothetical protein
MMRKCTHQFALLSLLFLIKNSASQTIHPLEPNKITTSTTEVQGFVDTTRCYDSLFTADANFDDKVDREEYVTFLKSESPPAFLEGVTRFEDLTLDLQSNFIAIACRCKFNGGGDTCCVGDNAHISTQGAAPNDTPSLDQLSQLFLVCWLTATAIDRNTPTSTPSPISDVPTMTPTDTPTTRVPITASPTLSPSPEPSPEPTPAPSPGPTTKSPTLAPTLAPMSAPTLEPTLEPTKRPTQPPTTASLTPSPSDRPSEVGATPSPTTTPTPSPTKAPVTSEPSEEDVGTKPPSADGRVDAVGRATYSIVVNNGARVVILSSAYEPDLIGAMNILALELAAEVDENNGGRMRRRKLEVRVSLPTSIDAIIDAGGFTAEPELTDGIFQNGGS